MGDGGLEVLEAERLGGRIVIPIGVSGAVERVTFSAKGAELGHVADASLAVGLLPAMRRGRSLVLHEPVSPRLLAAVPRIQEIVRNWEQRRPVYGQFRAVSVNAEPRRGRRAADPHQADRDTSSKRTASFFTAGVDSFYTVARHRDVIDALIFVHGFDVRLNDETLDAKVSSGVRAAAAELGKPLVEVTTDLRSFSDRHVHWPAYHGAALATVALLLSEQFGRVYVPATLTYAHLVPLGSHPLLDPLWSTEDVEMVHDGCEASRLEKISLISDDPAARARLRVCWENRSGLYNCGSCEKCLRTMVAMRALGVLGRFETLPKVIDHADIAGIELPEVRYTWEASLDLLRRTHVDPALTGAISRRLYGTRGRIVQGGLRYARRARPVITGVTVRIERARRLKPSAHVPLPAGIRLQLARLVGRVRSVGAHRRLDRRVRTYFGEPESLADRERVLSARICELDAARGVGSVATEALSLPLDGRVTSPFGTRFERMHHGIDMAAPAGTPVSSASAGVVLLAQSFMEYGNTTVISHGSGLTTLYAHQSSIVVQAGDRVDAGQTIGLVGSSGRTTGPHLHFETRINGVPCDPLGLVAGESGEAMRM